MTNKIKISLILLIAIFLRLWRLQEVPVSLFGDELDVGYQAYSILKTGKDYYGNSWPIHFHSLAEWRTPLYLYATVPSVAVFGISSLGVRLPAAIFGSLGVLATYLLVKEMLSYKQPSTNKHPRALLAALLMAINPWALQYSRAGFEVTLLILLLLLGLWLFFKALSEGKWLWLSAIAFALCPWVYSTAKLFIPLLLIFLFLAWRSEILRIPKKFLIISLSALLVVGTPIAYSTFFGGGSERFNYISVFSDPTTEPEVGSARNIDAKMRGEGGVGATPTLVDRILHNKFTFWEANIAKNYFQAFSTDFLFIKGDLNLRHSVGIGEFFKVEAVGLLLGIIFFFIAKRDIRIKLLIIFWLTAGVIPSAITRDGGNHATRLILILPPLLFLISYGWLESYKLVGPRLKTVFMIFVGGLYGLSVIAYLHIYYVHYPWASERWWHAGFRESIQSIKEVEKDYQKVIISTANEPPWVFFAAWYAYPPEAWQAEFPIGNDVDLKYFGKVSHTDKFYFGSAGVDLYTLGQVLDEETLYLATEKEVKVNLIQEPQRLPQDLNLIKAIAYPSGEPAFYLFSGK